MIELQKEHFEAWVESQPDERKFEYTNPYGCVIASFIRETTSYKSAACTTTYWRPDYLSGLTPDLPEWLRTISNQLATLHLQKKLNIAEIKKILGLPLSPPIVEEIKQNETVQTVNK